MSASLTLLLFVTSCLIPLFFNVNILRVREDLVVSLPSDFPLSTLITFILCVHVQLMGSALSYWVDQQAGEQVL